MQKIKSAGKKFLYKPLPYFGALMGKIYNGIFKKQVLWLKEILGIYVKFGYFTEIAKNN